MAFAEQTESEVRHCSVCDAETEHSRPVGLRVVGLGTFKAPWTCCNQPEHADIKARRQGEDL